MNLAFQAKGRARALRRRIAWPIDHLYGAVQFLLGNEQRGIDGQRFLKFGDGFVQFACLRVTSAPVNDEGAA